LSEMTGEPFIIVGRENGVKNTSSRFSDISS
jgi:hypothetical protein